MALPKDTQVVREQVYNVLFTGLAKTTDYVAQDSYWKQFTLKLYLHPAC